LLSYSTYSIKIKKTPFSNNNITVHSRVPTVPSPTVPKIHPMAIVAADYPIKKKNIYITVIFVKKLPYLSVKKKNKK